MFTGIIEEIGKIKSIKNKGLKKLITIECSLVLQNTEIGQSICTDGVCLTVCSKTVNTFIAEVMSETISKTIANFYNTGQKVNLERAMLLSSRLDGHIVQGHVDTVTKVKNITHDVNNFYIECFLPSNFAKLAVLHGSVTINGVSLTIAKLTNSSFTVSIINHTKSLTNLSLLKTGSLVNVEFDIIGKYILRDKEYESKKITEDSLRKLGY